MQLTGGLQLDRRPAGPSGWKRRAAKFLACTMLGASACVALVPSPALAVNAGINFGGTISQNAFCRIFVRRSGIMVASPDNLQLSSTLVGGRSGVADVWSIPAYDVTAETVPYFASTAPSGGNTGVSMAVEFSGSSIWNGINFPPQDGSTPVTLNSGFSITRMFVDLTASRPTPFPAGNYGTIVTLRCE